MRASRTCPDGQEDVVGLKALAIFAAKAFENVRPGGVKVRAGAPILEQGLVEADFAEMAAAGVGLLGEIGLGSVKTADEAAPMVAWARQYGMVSTIHTGGPSLPGSSAIDADVVIGVQPDIVGHINGGTTSMPPSDIERLVDTAMALEIVHNGNGSTALLTLRLAAAAGALRPRYPGHRFTQWQRRHAAGHATPDRSPREPRGDSA